MLEFILTDGTAIPKEAVSRAYNAFSFCGDTITDDQFKSMVKGIKVRNVIDKYKRTVTFAGHMYTVTDECHYGNKKTVLTFKDSNIFGGLRIAYEGNYYHERTRPAIELAQSLASTIAFQLAKSTVDRKAIEVYCKSPVDLAATLLAAIGFERTCESNITEFYKTYNPEQALELLKKFLRNYNIQLTFMENDGKRRELFQSMIGENRLVFSEQAV